MGVDACGHPAYEKWWRRSSGNGIFVKAPTRERPVFPGGTHSLENRTEAIKRGTCPVTSRKSRRRHPAISINRWTRVCLAVSRCASTCARSRW